MYTILNRKQFIQLWKDVGIKFAEDPDSPLWIPENDGKKSRWFVAVNPVKIDSYEDQTEFWIWNQKNCRGQIRCYASGVDDEWWGFTHKADIEWWLLKWGG